MKSLKRKQPEVKPPDRHLSGSDLRRQSAEDALRNEPGTLHVGFGKYRDLTLQQLVNRDKEYCRWVLAQSADHFKIRRLQDYLKQTFPTNAESTLNPTPETAEETAESEAKRVSLGGPAPSWVQDLLRLSRDYDEISDDLEDCALSGLPGETRKSLHRFQRHGIAFGVQRGGRVLLADEMGLGKTVQALGIASFYRREWPALIVVPSSLRLAWKSEISRWLNVQAIQVIRSGADRFYADKDFYIISYDLLQKHPKFQDRAGKSFDIVICDESHLLKSWHAQRTCQILPLLQNARRAVLISGSPALNNAFELYPQLTALLPSFVPGPSDFGERYCCVDSFQGQERFTGSVRPSELRQLLSTVMLRRGKAEVLSQLPPKRRRSVPLELPVAPEDLQWHGDAQGIQEADEEKESKGYQSYQSVYARVGLAKAEVAADYVEMLLDSMNDSKVLVFFHHEVVGNIIENKLKHSKVAYVRIDGKTPQVRREAEVLRFQEQPSVRIAVLSITACGLGLTLTAASVIVFAELYSVPKIMEQAEDRAHRIGQTKSIDIHYLVAHGTVDDSILACLARKEHELQHLLQSNGGEASTEEMQNKIVPAVRASARPLAQNAAIRKAFATSKENKEKKEKKEIPVPPVRTVKSPGLKMLGDQDMSISHRLTSMGFTKAEVDEAIRRVGNFEDALEILLEQNGAAGNTSKKQPLVLSDSEEEIPTRKKCELAPTMEDPDSDVQVTMEDSDSDVQIEYD